MPVFTKDVDKVLKELLNQLSGELKSQHEFLSKITKEDDWSFVIKAHALIEASVTQLLVDSVGDERYKRVFERLPLSDEEIGKLAVAKELGFLTKEQRRFIRSFSTLRNHIVHRVENVGFSFAAHISKMDPAQKKSWQESMAWFPKDAASREKWNELVLSTPKMTLWVSVFMLIGECSITCTELRGKRKTDELALKTGEELFGSLTAGTKKKPNQALEPTRGAVTPRAP